MFTKSVLVAALAALSSATPISVQLLGPRELPSPGCGSTPFNPTLPVNGGDHELPAPAANMTLQRIALGMGVQNYTCSAAGADPVATGALAMLYDITSLTPGAGPHALDKDAFNKIAATALSTHPVPLNFDHKLPHRVPGAHTGVSSSHPFTADAPLHLNGFKPMPFVGHHFFTDAGVPAFVLDNGALEIDAVKVDAVNAPASAFAGPDGTGAVAWLFLTAGPGSKDLTAVYRLLTAGGNPHGCKAAGDDTTTYAATYWFYS